MKFQRELRDVGRGQDKELVEIGDAAPEWSGDVAEGVEVAVV